MGSFMSKDIEFKYEAPFLNELDNKFMFVGKSALEMMTDDVFENIFNSYDIYIKNMNIFDMYKLLSKYGKCYIYGDKNNDYTKSRISIYYNNSWYEFTNTYKNDFNVLRYGYNDEVIDLDDDKYVGYIRPVKYNGDFNEEYFTNIYNIMKYFKVASYCNKQIDDQDIELIRKYCETATVVYDFKLMNDLMIIFDCVNNDRLFEILNLMFMTGVFTVLDIEFNNFTDFLMTMKYNDWMFKLLLNVKCDNIYNWVKKRKISLKKYDFYIENVCTVNHCRKFLDVKTKVDLRKYIYDINRDRYNTYKINSVRQLNEHLKYMYDCLEPKKYTIFEMLKEYNFPYTFYDVDVDSYKYVKSNVVDLIMEELVENDLEKIKKCELIKFY